MCCLDKCKKVNFFRMSKSVIFAYGSETGMGASIIEEAYAVAAETITDFDLALPEEVGTGAYFFG